MRNQLTFQTLKNITTPTTIESQFENKSFYLSFKTQLLQLHFLKLEAVLTGSLTVDCNLCADCVELEIDENITVVLSDKVYNEGLDYQGFAVLEYTDGKVDLDDFVRSELMLIASDYHYCEICTTKRS